jgi:phosphatidylethanolamine/phosphatidyl-N-methylethanolamine N-methyltransferase
MLRDIRLFISEFRNNWINTGAIAPSSSRLAKAIVNPMRQRPQNPIAILEVGPGTGAFTQQICSVLRAGDYFDIYELNPRFCSFLRRQVDSYRLDRRGVDCKIHNEDIRNLSSGMKYDYIISGLPLNNFSAGIVSEILRTFSDHLKIGGTLSYFEYNLLFEIKSCFLNPLEKQEAMQVRRTVMNFVNQHQVASDQVWWNLPPARAHHCHKKDLPNC